MSDSNRLNAVAPILKHYQVEPYFVEDFGKIVKVYSNKGTFALKKIVPNSGTDFIRHVHQLYQKGYNRIVPIYPTNDGRYAVLHDKDLYYLMPWLSNDVKENRKERHQQLFRELARLHTLSSKEITVKKEERTEHYEKTIQQFEKNQEFLTGFIEECEKKTYMSPFQLLFCLYFNEIVQALSFSKKKFEEWYEKTKEQEKARMVINHGKISSEHFLFDEKGYGYFANFEDAGFGSPIHDLLPFLSRSLKTNPKRNDECVDWITHYFKYFPFKADEKLLFYSYLSYPLPIIQVVEKYYRKQNPKNELKFVQHLQHQYWYLKNTEYVAMRMTELEQEEQTKEGAPPQ
ncbi:spore coat protein YsxE [Neobacillus sp. PS3-40]|jgi:spore coat protein YsxE|uniref:spore coat protein YsxE n=1 Tax=Neobacillus sp. PS3-40 TaxID=3070679 RepID=UPI0027DFACE8|nr:spore coat protein YsxE [Neobacillus sp. PS3-40]WML45566.1 spore coat protein YsxE [Neobacillus sp. PS3-40]